MIWFRLTSIKKKLLAAYLPMILIPGIVISFAAYSLFAYEMERASYRHAEQTAEMINRHLDTYLDELERLSLFPYFHSNVMEILSRSGDGVGPDEQYREYKLFDDMFGNIMLNPREDLLNVFLYREDGKRYFNSRVHVALNIHYNWKDTDWYRETLRANGAVVYTPNSDDDGRFDVLPYETFSISRLIKNDNGVVLGAILIDANFQGVAAILRDVGLGDKANVVLKDADGNVMFAQNDRFLNELSNAGAGTHHFRNQGETLFVGSSVSETTGWTTSVVLPSDDISASFVSMRSIVLWMLVLFGFVALFVTYWFSDGLTKPLRKLHRMARMVEAGNYNLRMDVRGVDEIGSLGQAFNNMTAQIKALIHEVYEHDLRQKEAELNSLKMQIRPHFLYNTLEAIRSLAEIHDNQDIAEMTTSLGSILRYSIKTHEKLVLLGKEFDHIRQYMNIHLIMFQDAIRIETDIEPELLRYYSIPLLFQPIVENAFQHGLYGTRSGGLLRIVGRRLADGELEFTIRDNGRGVPPETLERINRSLEAAVVSDAGGGGIGLVNVNQRIRIVFGPAYGVSIANDPDGGTIVRVRIPAVDSPDELPRKEQDAS